jgi:hypothetical protein
MAPPPKNGGNAVNAVLAKFRKDQAKSVAVVAEAAKEREEKLKKVAAGGNDNAFLSLRPSSVFIFSWQEANLHLSRLFLLLLLLLLLFFFNARRTKTFNQRCGQNQ